MSDEEHRIVEAHGTYRHMEYWVIGHTDLGHRCGYVGVLPEIHKNWSDDFEPDPEGGYPNNPYEDSIFGHGGITFYSAAVSDNWYTPFDGTVIGFDCAHAGDARDPELLKRSKYGQEYLSRYSYRTCAGDAIRTKEYCIGECERMIDQLWSKVDEVHGALLEAQYIAEKEEKSNALDNSS
jgi:hypothetical protein